MRAPRARACSILQHDDAGALAHDEAVAVAVVGAEASFGRSLKPVDKARQAAKPASAMRQIGELGAARDHHVGVAQRDDAGSVADGVRARRAGRHCMVRPLELVLDGNVAGGEVDQAAGDEEQETARPFSFSGERGLGDAQQPADAGADEHAGALLLLAGRRLVAGVGERLVGGGHRVDDEVVDLALLLRLHPVVGVDLPSLVAPRGMKQAIWQEMSETSNSSTRRAPLGAEQGRPRRLDAAAERRNDPRPVMTARLMGVAILDRPLRFSATAGDRGRPRE